jgi:vanillate O-demethylase monooxygenase subunit
MRQFEGSIDRWFIYDFVRPGTLLRHSGGRLTGADPANDHDQAVRLHSCQTLTPETEHTTHYFFQQSHPAGQGSDSLTQAIHDSVIAAFNEDRDMITAQSRSIDMNPRTPMLPLGMDLAVVQFRRLIEQAIQAERAAA